MLNLTLNIQPVLYTNNNRHSFDLGQHSLSYICLAYVFQNGPEIW